MSSNRKRSSLRKAHDEITRLKTSLALAEHHIQVVTTSAKRAALKHDALATSHAELERQNPVAWVEVVSTHEGPYNFEGMALLGKGTHYLYARPIPAEQPVNARLLEVLRFYAEGHHFIRHDTDAWDTVSGEPQNFLEDEANTATVEDGSLAKAALSAIGEVPISFDLKTALDGVKNFFDGEYFHIDEIVDASQVCGQKQEEECQPEFDHCFVNQSGGGITGDDYHGTVFFHVGAGQYLTVRY